MKKPTLKQERWQKAYLATGNLTKATIAAGYNIGGKGGKPENRANIAKEIGRENLRKLATNIAEARKEEHLTWLTPEYILNSLRDLAEGKNIPIRSKIAALELMGKSLALFTDKHEMSQRIAEITAEISVPWQEKPSQQEPSQEK